MTSPSILELAAFTSAFAAAERAGIFTALREAPDDAAGLARRLGLDPRAAELVLHVLRTWKLVSLEGGRYRAGDMLASELASHGGTMLTVFARTPEFLERGETVFPETAAATGRETVYAGVVASLGQRFACAAEQLAIALDAFATETEEILEVGAGSGVWGLAQLARLPGARLTALDLPGVLEHTAERARGLGLEGRVTLLPGDVHRTELREHGYDRIVLANVLHLEPAPVAASLLGRLGRALRPGGRFVIVDSMATQTPELDRVHRAYALFLALRVPYSRAHPEADLRSWLAGAGLGGERRIDLPGPPVGISALVSTRAGAALPRSR